MTPGDIIEMVQDAYERGQSDLMESCKEVLAQAIAVAVAAEREACAKVCEEIKGVKLQGYEFAAAIRARGHA